jgi:hypothetical protein
MIAIFEFGFFSACVILLPIYMLSCYGDPCLHKWKLFAEFISAIMFKYEFAETIYQFLNVL